MIIDNIEVFVSIQDSNWRLEVSGGIINFYIGNNTAIIEVKNVAPDDAEHFANGLLEAVKRVRAKVNAPDL